MVSFTKANEDLRETPPCFTAESSLTPITVTVCNSSTNNCAEAQALLSLMISTANNDN